MSLDPRALATLGIGYGPLPMAMLGIWPVGGPPAVPPAPTFGPIYGVRAGARSSLRRTRRRREDELLIVLGGRK